MTEKTSLNDIIGIVKTDEPTNSVDEVRKLRGRDRMTEKRFRLDTGCIIEMEENKLLSDIEIRNLLNKQDKEIKDLKQAVIRAAFDNK